jgi:hypothetical protein
MAGKFSELLRVCVVVGLSCTGLLGCSEDKELTTECGMVYQGELENSLREKYARHGHMTAVDGRGYVSVRLDGDEGTILVALHGLSDEISPQKAAGAQHALNAVLTSHNTGGYYVEAVEGCRKHLDDQLEIEGEAQPGQFILDNDSSLSEVLLSAGLAEIEEKNTCRSDLMKSCYQALLLEAGDFPDPTPTPGEEKIVHGR